MSTQEQKATNIERAVNHVIAKSLIKYGNKVLPISKKNDLVHAACREAEKMYDVQSETIVRILKSK